MTELLWASLSPLRKRAVGPGHHTIVRSSGRACKPFSTNGLRKRGWSRQSPWDGATHWASEAPASLGPSPPSPAPRFPLRKHISQPDVGDRKGREAAGLTSVALSQAPWSKLLLKNPLWATRDFPCADGTAGLGHWKGAGTQHAAGQGPYPGWSVPPNKAPDLRQEGDYAGPEGSALGESSVFQTLKSSVSCTTWCHHCGGIHGWLGSSVTLGCPPG